MCVADKGRGNCSSTLNTERDSWVVLGERKKIRKSEGVRVTENIWMDIEETWSLVWTDTERYLDKNLGKLERIFENGKGLREPKEKVGDLRRVEDTEAWQWLKRLVSFQNSSGVQRPIAVQEL